MTSPSSAESAPVVAKPQPPSAGPLQVFRGRLLRGDLGQLPVVLQYSSVAADQTLFTFALPQ